MADRFMTLAEIRAIPDEDYPQAVLANNVQGLFALTVNLVQQDFYGHFVWLIAPDVFASQWYYFRTFPVDHFGGCTLKLIHNPDWKPEQRAAMLAAIRRHLDRPWYQTLYDVPGIFGKLLRLNWINIPWLNYCSETAKFMAIADTEFAQYLKKNPTLTPGDFNKFTKARQERFRVYGRYMPD